MEGNHPMTTAELIAVLNRVLDEEEALAAALRGAEMLLVEAEERAEDRTDDASLKAAVERCAVDAMLAERAVRAVRERRTAIEALLSPDHVLAAHRWRLATRGTAA
ncbi:MAG: hypothetical protein ACJ8H8_29830 [Geminicoccaceae bacterium]